MKMLALVLNAPKDLTLEMIPVKEPSADEILIRVKACGVCGTDLHLYEGTGGAMDSGYPLIMGHEFAGEIVRCGDAVTDLKPGDHVAVDPNVYCGKCEPCRSGEVHFCQNMVGIGTTAPGAFAEYCTVPSKSAYKVDPSLSLDVAAMMEPVGCCLHGVDRASIQPGYTTAIIGFGPAGQIIAQLALLSGSARLIVIEPVAEKRAMAKAIGASSVIDPLHEDVQMALKAHGITHINTVFECVGRKETMELALDIASYRATVMLFGLAPPKTIIDVYPFDQLFKKELTLTSSFINPLVAERAINLLTSGRLKVNDMITDRIPLRDSINVFTDESFRKRGKIIIGDF